MSYYIGVLGNININSNKENILYRQLHILIGNAVDLKNNYEDKDFDDSIYIVSGLIEKGIPKLAYKIADELNYHKVGIDSELAKMYDDTPKKFITKYIKGKYGEEVEYFIKNIDILVVLEPMERDKLKIDLANKKNIPVLHFTKTGKVGGIPRKKK